MAFVVGLTGGIASGKSTVADRLENLGASIVDTDRIAREVVEPGTEGLAAVRSAFGDQVVTPAGALDRSALRAIIFADDEARQRLNGILHPLIRQRALAAVEAATGAYVVLVVPLMVESGMDALVDRVLLVDVPEAVQVERLMNRDGCDRQQAEAALRAQASRAERRAIADDVLVNDGDRTSLLEAVDTLHQRYLALAGSQD